MKTPNVVLLLLSVGVVAGGMLLLIHGQNTTAMQASLAVSVGVYDIVGSADVNGDGEITTADVLFVKSCVGQLTPSIPPGCRGAWQQVTVSNPPDGVVKYQKVGRADVNGDGKVTLGDVLYVGNCRGKPASDPCHGELRRRRVISGRVVDTSGNGVSGAGVTAIGVDRDGDAYP